MSIDPGGLSILADRLELIRTIGRNIAGTAATPDARDAKTQETSTLPADPAVDGFVAKDDGSHVLTDSAGRERAALLTSMMQALRPPIAGSGQNFRQALNAALAQPPADLAQEDGAPATSNLLTSVRLAPGSAGELSYPAYSRIGDTLAMPVATDRFLTTHTATDLAGPAVESPWKAGTEPEHGLVLSAPPFEGADDLLLEPSGVKTPVAALNAMTGDEATRTPLAMTKDAAERTIGPAGDSASSALATRAFDASVQAELILKALSELELGAVAAGIVPMATERAGVLASFVLNAHFLPGWPPARPIESPEAKALVNTLAQDKNLSKSDIELLTYLANFGVSRAHLEKLLKALKRAAKRSGLLRALACFLTNLSAALRALGTEVDAIITDLTLEEQMQTRHASGNRRRIDLG